jgi:hypothetical protein
VRSAATVQSKRVIYSAFFMNNAYVRSSLAAVVDECEAQPFILTKE